jgi:excisionase family DNA binding protein
MERMLTARQVCDLLHINRNTLYKYARAGMIAGHFIARQWRFKESDIRLFLDRTAQV